LKGVRAKPKPYGGTRPLIMNAGASATGQAFAIRNCDALFSTISRGISFEETARHVSGVQALAQQAGRNIDVYTVGVVTCRPTEREAQDYYQYAVVDNADWAAVDNILAMKNITPQLPRLAAGFKGVDSFLRSHQERLSEHEYGRGAWGSEPKS
jgi:alkanesulfonate monooxygenase SsuD/methylene tetrahydromethanopterin reductase-like flavin-dependent oxidoreductase (luciferase family)